ncbi:G2 and S phase-expressed protein 1-like isoform X1 [Hydractinia symbiolongicarpus]|uniref:G2 and S phase-expressed protein 1-like isoform X1 n=1 Tax=Hydractinia symbiolongicarpus TaxID=13093 RepID=UPI002551B838|nr:G2 and S phase-expressed protein 1-like isoform X1 [Hydractinia symbiolongicarpus]
MSTAEDWLSDEKFDFNVSASPAAEDACLVVDTDDNEDDDEEVFFGPQSFAEKCVATVVKEKEELVIEDLNPEQQALLLRESALLSLMIKHGTPNSTRASPIAVVHPMKRGGEKEPSSGIVGKNLSSTENMAEKENIHEKNSKAVNKNVTLAETSAKLKSSKILQPRFSMKNRTSSQPLSATKLPVFKSRGKIQSENSEPLVDQVSLYGLSKEVVKKETGNSKAVRRRSGLPVKQSNDTSEQKSKSAAMPFLLPSAIPPSRVKANSSSNVESKLKPVKVSSLSQLRPPRKNTQPLQGTPIKTSKARDTPAGKAVNISSTKRQIDSKKFSTPSTQNVSSSIKKTEGSKKVSSNASLVTPVQRTPSSRKSITGRQILPKAQGTCEPATSVLVEDTTFNKTQASSETNITSSTQSLPSHSSIIDRYKKLCESKNVAQSSSDATNPAQKLDDVLPNSKAATGVTKENADRLSEGEHCQQSPKKEETALVLLLNESPLLHLSPVKSKENSLDPFETGHTPPPLIDIGDVLQPERTKETNLIEF